MTGMTSGPTLPFQGVQQTQNVRVGLQLWDALEDKIQMFKNSGKPLKISSKSILEQRFHIRGDNMFYLLFAFALLSGCSTATKCELPSSDIQKGPPPAISGQVLSITREFNIIKVTSGNATYRVSLSKIERNHVFTQFGGIIRIDEIYKGDSIDVWLESCSLPRDNLNQAVAVRVHK